MLKYRLLSEVGHSAPGSGVSTTSLVLYILSRRVSLPQVLLDALDSAHQVAYSEKALPVGRKKTDSGNDNDSDKRPSAKTAEVKQHISPSLLFVCLWLQVQITNSSVKVEKMSKEINAQGELECELC